MQLNGCGALDTEAADVYGIAVAIVACVCVIVIVPRALVPRPPLVLARIATHRNLTLPSASLCAHSLPRTLMPT